MLLSDFNTVLGYCDRLSRKLDSISGLLGDLVTFASSSEPSGHVQFTYQHPSVHQRQSRIDYIFLPDSWSLLYKQTAHFIKNSDHYAVQAFPVPLRQSGPGSWQCEVDILDVCGLKIRECINVSYSETLSPTVV